MKNIFYSLALIFTVILTACGQTNPYEAVNAKLGISSTEPEVLWPFEMEGVTVEDISIQYEAPFEEIGSDITFDFGDFETVKSQVFDMTKVDRDDLLEGFEAGIPGGFNEDFKRVADDNFCYLISKEGAESAEEVYLLVGNADTAELLYMKYGENASELHEKITVELSNALN